MSFGPDYGETLVAEEILELLTEQARAVVGNPAARPTFTTWKGGLAQVAVDRLTAVLEGSLTADEICHRPLRSHPPSASPRRTR